MHLNLDVPNKLLPFLESRHMYQVLYGGRASAKTHTVISKLIILRALVKKTKILCTRETQTSIEQSTYAELREFIYKYGLDNPVLPTYFTIQKNGIYCSNGSEFIFRGLARDIMQIKSIPDIDICFIEEAETIGEMLWEVLDPTLRKDGCEVIVCFNPRESTSATYKRFIETDYGDDILRIEINYPDNPFLSDTILKKIYRLKDQDYARYEHIYLGKVLDMSEDVIFKGRFRIEEVDVKWNGRNWVYKGQAIAPLYGLDFGFSVHPMAIIEIFMLDEDTLYISREIYETGLLITKVPQRIKEVMPEALHDEFYADHASPDKIAQLNHEGIRCIGATKGTGSVEAGVDWLLSKNIIIHPSCKNTIYEFYNYKYKTDKNSGKITRDIIKANDHACDAIRYGCYKLISANVFSYDNYESIF